ncbi:MAG: CpaF family protein [Paracoccaceae bacterium]
MFANFNKRSSRDENQVVQLDAVRSALNTDNDEKSEIDRALLEHLELKNRLHGELLNRLNLSVIDKIEKSELRRQVAGFVTQFLKDEGTALLSENLSDLIDELIFEVMGLGPLEPLLADPTINDILVNTHENVFIERFGKLEKTNVRFHDERHLLRIIDKIVSRVGRRIDESQPWVDARLEDGSRINAIIRPCSVDGPTLSIRKFSRKPLTLEKLIESGSLTENSAAVLKALVQARLNILISGGTGSGKTTLLNAISSYIDPSHRIITIEDAAELQLLQEHVVRLETRPPNAEGNGAILQRDLVKNALRMRPDRIIVGEVRGAECFDMLQAMNTGHDGSMTTVHANTARDALGRVEQMVTMLGTGLPISTIRSQISAAINIVVQLARMSDGKRRVISISEISGMEGDVITMQDLFVFERRGVSETGEILGDFVATGIRPKCAEQLLAAGLEIDQGIFKTEGATQ